MHRTWPLDWEARARGEACPFCGDLRTRSFYNGRTSEALLERQAVSGGHAVVVFRGRHAASLTALAPGELADYWHDIQDVARLLQQVFSPCHMNYLLLGNVVPHLHVHVVPRYLDDPAPGRALPWEPHEVAAAEYERQFERLQAIGSAVTPAPSARR